MRLKHPYLGCLIAAAVLLPATGCKKERGPTRSDCEQACQRIADLREASRWWLSDGLAYDEEGEGDDDSGGDEGDLGEWDEEEDQPAPRNAGRDLLDEEREVMEDGQRRRRAVSFETCVEQCQGKPVVAPDGALPQERLRRGRLVRLRGLAACHGMPGAVPRGRARGRDRRVPAGRAHPRRAGAVPLTVRSSTRRCGSAPRSPRTRPTGAARPRPCPAP